jgi:hypothetical protein
MNLKVSTTLKAALLLTMLFGCVESGNSAASSMSAATPMDQAALLQTLQASVPAREPRVVDALGWLEQKVTADDGGSLDAFGWSVTIRGDTAFVGAYYASVGAGVFQGAVYVFKESAGQWTQVQKLTASDGASGDNFGTAVAYDGSTLLVGAPEAAVGSAALQGAIYVFTETDGVWTQRQKLVADDEPTLVRLFGISVAVVGDQALVGAHGVAVGGDNYQGTVYALARTDGTWTQTQKLTASDGVGHDQFGQQLVMDGTTALIGADQSTYANDYPGPGAAYVFDFDASSGTWGQTQKLVADDGTDADYFGRWVALSGTNALIGAPAANDFQGATYAFSMSGGTWTQTQKLLAADGSAGDYFGDSVAIDGTHAVVGAPGAAIDGNPVTGAAYLFDLGGAGWNQTGKLTSSDGTTGDEFGYAVALRGDDTVFAGAPHPTDDGSGSAGTGYFYSRDAIFADGFDGSDP